MPTNYNGYTVPSPTDIADAPAAFEEFSDSIPFNEYVAIESLSADTTVVDSYNGKMIFATADLTLTFGTLTDGFSVAVTADTGVTVDYLGVDKASQQSTAYQVASVVAVNSVNIISIAGASAPPCPPCPPAGTPEATITAITGSGITHTYGSYIAYEFLTSGTITSTEGTVPEALIIGAGGGGGGQYYAGGGGSGGYTNITQAYLSSSAHAVTIGSGGAATIGAGGSTINIQGSNGEPSQLGSYVAVGGGLGASYSTPLIVGFDGSSGGGAAGTVGSVAGYGQVGQGNDGGAKADSAGGGGGGAGSAGGDATATGIAAPGGSGLSSSITGVAVGRAGGGGGGSSANPGTASDGGGAGGTQGGFDGDDNSGGGAGGGGANSGYGLGGVGGSGVVIVKVLATNASSVDTSGWTEVTAAMLAAAEKKRKAEVKKLEKKLALQLKSEELSGQTNKTDIKENE